MQCFACESSSVRTFYTVATTPTSSITLVPDRAIASAWPMGRVELGICHECGFIQNSAFEPSAIDYSKPYEESQAASPTFQKFAIETASMLDRRFQLRGKTMFEVGCGKAEWMALACRELDMRGLGIDPSYVPGRVSPEDADRIDVLVEFFDDTKTHLTGDLVACRHTLEHIQPARAFAALLVESLRKTPGAGLFIEVPDSRRILEEGAYWDVYYEHCSYFTSETLLRLLQDLGCGDVEIDLAYGDQYLLATAIAGGSAHPTTPVEPIVALAESFAGQATTEVDRWQQQIDPVLEAGGHVVVWGASSKAVGFMAAVDRQIEAAVDINPAKHGSFLPGTGTPVIAPADLVDVDPRLVIIMNPIYRAEITADIDRLGVKAEVLALGEA